ncbi:kxDL motif-containing protein CG10681 [Acyrthosiphon pisum]|uniref:ACYPI007857 protein n=1 Tax=Acyrthosiphon pisum TaxID=7029 RepID=C4WXC4_ACYPI|nr:kxDL motif-containing protein CG10681 [Acyrthosiphon pisum]BAH72544.1 ACYPI007857 [Acyrthosiphon pisum]|eukprot:NP_001280369.1 kxDL motif-containing protein CG10681 [Acyrthosiphon pisum]
MADTTSELDETPSIECFQNYTAPEVSIQGIAGIVNQEDVESMIIAQKEMLQRFEKTNEMLTNCNSLSMSHLKTTSQDLKKHTQMLAELRKDLDSTFKRIATIRSKIKVQHPDLQKSILEEKQKELEQKTVDSSSSGSASTASPYNSDTN